LNRKLLLKDREIEMPPIREGRDHVAPKPFVRSGNDRGVPTTPIGAARRMIGPEPHLIDPMDLSSLSAVCTTPRQGFKISWYFVQNVMINILGFVPLGYFLMGFLLAVPHPSRLHQPRVAVLVILLSAALSLMVEVLQIYLPSRDSSLVDVLANTLGTGLGVVLYLADVIHSGK
jgi:hypothetical protein